MSRKKDRLLAAAILAVLLEEAEGQALQSSEGRELRPETIKIYTNYYRFQTSRL